MKKIAVVGHFGKNLELADGQTIKTRTIYSELCKKFGKEEIITLDTYNYKKRMFLMLLTLIYILLFCDEIIVLPAQNSVKIFIPLFTKFSNKKVHYIMIGGWLPEVVKNDNGLKESLKKVKAIYAETSFVMKELEANGIKNVVLMKNFKNLTPALEKKEINKNIKCCIFSRIEYLKGITDAINVVNKINEKYNITLDIYGKIKDEYFYEFNNLIKNNKYIKYKGIIESNKSVSTIKNYDLLLFPTKYETEGIPGTIIDAYYSGVPILSSKWRSYDDVIIEGKTGIGYVFNDIEDFYVKLEYIINNPKILKKMSKNCIDESIKYTAEESLKILFNNLM